VVLKTGTFLYAGLIVLVTEVDLDISLGAYTIALVPHLSRWAGRYKLLQATRFFIDDNVSSWACTFSSTCCVLKE